MRQRKAAARTGESLRSIWLLMREWPRPKGRFTVAVTDIDDAVAIKKLVGSTGEASNQPDDINTSIEKRSNLSLSVGNGGT